MRLFQIAHTSEGIEIGRWWVRAETQDAAEQMMQRLVAGVGMDPRVARRVEDFGTPEALRRWGETGAV